jgi:FkbM family methyltransferase
MDEYSIETEWFWRGIAGWEAASIQIWMNLCRSKAIGATPTIMDIGACEGIYALVASALAPDSKVVAVEPLPDAFKRLEANICLNKRPIYAFEAACSDFDGSAPLYSNGCANSTEASLVSGSVCKTSTCVVKTRTVDSLVKELGLSSVDLVKIDVEGAEPGVIKGMEDYLASSRPVMLVEVLNNNVAEELAKIMSWWNYRFWDINDDPRNGALGVKRMPRIRNGICLNWLFVPVEKEPLLCTCWSEWLLE